MKKNPNLPNSQRRTFLKAAAGFMGATLFGGIPFKAFAQATDKAPDRYFIFVYFSGGWDQLLAFDPRDPAEFTPERVSETRILPGYSLIGQDFPAVPYVPEKDGVRSNIAFGPALARPTGSQELSLADHFDLMTVVRGINMTTLGHDVGFRYFLTGKRPIGSAARGSSTATEIVGQFKPAVPIPSVAYNIESYNDRYPGYANALRVSRTEDMLLTLSPSPTALDSEIEKQLLDFRGQPITCEAAAYGARGVGTTYENSRDQMQEVVSNHLDQAFRFEVNTPENADVRATYNLPSTKPANGYDSTESGRAALVATAIKKGISQCVSINLTGGLDTHFGTQLTHASNQRRGFQALARLVGDLRKSIHPVSGKSFMDHTTIMVFSEFSRTPLINASGGRDHHLCNSCLIMGAGVKHNYVYGASGDIGMSPGTFDLRTGTPTPTGENILPEHIIATVLASAKLDYAITRVSPLQSILA